MCRIMVKWWNFECKIDWKWCQARYIVHLAINCYRFCNIRSQQHRLTIHLCLLWRIANRFRHREMKNHHWPRHFGAKTISSSKENIRNGYSVRVTCTKSCKSNGIWSSFQENDGIRVFHTRVKSISWQISDLLIIDRDSTLRTCQIVNFMGSRSPVKR